MIQVRPAGDDAQRFHSLGLDRAFLVALAARAC